jgi:hypothetical protein
MADSAFTPEMQAALDRYAVPPLPPGFSDRLIARIAGGDTTETLAITELPARRRPSSPWRRTGGIIGSIAILSLATATAAAAGVFGDPVYLPGISEALVQVKIVDAPQPKAKPKPAMVAQKPASDEILPSAPVDTPKGSAAVVSRLGEMRDDPRYANLTPKQKFAVAGREVRNMVRSGEVTREEARTAVRELARNADPAKKAAVRAAIAERRANRQARRAQLATQPIAADVTEPQNDAAAATSDTLPVADTAQIAPERLDALRARYLAATPEERAAMRSELRARRQLRRLQ